MKSNKDVAEDRRDFARRVTREAGGILREALGRRVGVEKANGHVMSPVDLEVDALVLREIRAAFPEDALLTEESGFIEGSNECLWVVDSVDGTSNLRLGIPYASCGMAVVWSGETRLAVIYNPFNDEMFTAEKGAGAFLNGDRIHVSGDSESLEGFYQQGYGVAPADQMEVLRSLTAISRRVLNMWCPTLDWCNVACGRADYLVAYRTEIEDFIQGRLIVEEAGGRVTCWDGSAVEVKLAPGERVTAVASNGVVHAQILTHLARHPASSP